MKVVYHLPFSTLPPLILTTLPSVCVNFALYDCQLCPLWNDHFPLFPNHSVTNMKFRYERISEYIRIEKTIQTNIQIYSYQKNNTNEYLNIFVSKKWYERISEYIRIKNDTNMIRTNIPNRKYSNIWIYLYQIIVPTNI